MPQQPKRSEKSGEKEEEEEEEEEDRESVSTAEKKEGDDNKKYMVASLDPSSSFSFIVSVLGRDFTKKNGETFHIPTSTGFA